MQGWSPRRWSDPLAMDLRRGKGFAAVLAATLAKALQKVFRIPPSL
ncbi:hypothetical protein SynRS9909_02554 [Synechococcus sp. RS9909]|nr:hypothetical protein SynRS9909_02554 [Synechococcus sp. RS9909]